jgi:hypothetical protein
MGMNPQEGDQQGSNGVGKRKRVGLTSAQRFKIQSWILANKERIQNDRVLPKFWLDKIKEDLGITINKCSFYSCATDVEVNPPRHVRTSGTGVGRVSAGATAAAKFRVGVLLVLEDLYKRVGGQEYEFFKRMKDAVRNHETLPDPQTT